VGASTHFVQPFKNAFLSRNVDQNMLNNEHFLEKSYKIAAAFIHLPPALCTVTPAYCIALSSALLAIKYFITSKNN